MKSFLRCIIVVEFSVSFRKHKSRRVQPLSCDGHEHLNKFIFTLRRKHWLFGAFLRQIWLRKTRRNEPGLFEEADGKCAYGNAFVFSLLRSGRGPWKGKYTIPHEIWGTHNAKEYFMPSRKGLQNLYKRYLGAKKNIKLCLSYSLLAL